MDKLKPRTDPNDWKGQVQQTPIVGQGMAVWTSTKVSSGNYEWKFELKNPSFSC